MIAGPDALFIEGLRIRYGSRLVLQGLNLRISPGQIYGLLGPNGAGKTTLIRAICGRLKLEAGTMAIAGQPNGRASLRHVGLVPQELALYPHLSVRENLQVFGRLSGLSRKAVEAAIVWAAQATDLTPRLGDRVDILSGGWKRRVNIAAAILHRPALLILDEPTVGVDIDARNGLHEVITELSHTGMGVLLTTHDLNQAELICTSVGFLRDGVIGPQGNPRALIDAMFGQRKQVIIELRSALTAVQAQALSAVGFVAANGGMSWSMLSGPEAASAAELSIALDRSGIEVREIRYREPGLDSLFMSLSQPVAGKRAA
jgi:ABC-2 type transport system ATP-binding protein